MTLPISIQQSVEEILSCKVLQIAALYGGDINISLKLETDKGLFFLKWNDNKRFPLMFEKEARGLKRIADCGAINTPTVIATGNTEVEAFLLLSLIESSVQKKNFWELFGQQLATMHRCSSSKFGFDEDNYIGSLLQQNTTHDTFIDFFIQERLEVQLMLAEKSGKIETKHRKAFEALYKQLPNILPIEPPALLHGDLWSGNYMVNDQGEPCLIDPAVYYGYREIDLAMSNLFGRFDAAFYEGYHAAYPLEKGWQERLPIYNLYPLLVHVNLFGGGYLGEVERVLRYY